MKIFKSVLAFILLIPILFVSQTHLSSCKKEKIIRDTVVIHDTTVVHDTADCYDLQDGLVAYYNFNKGSLNDSSGNNNNIAFNNATQTNDRFGKANNAYLFNGSSSYMTVPNSASLNPTSAITLMAIVKFNSFYGTNCPANQIFGKGWNDYINGFYVLRTQSGGCNTTLDTTREVPYGNYGNLNGRNGAGDVNTFVHTNTWYNMIYTYEAGVGKFYLNGVLVNTTTTQSTVFTPNTQDLFIGKHGDPQFPYMFSGVIDEIRIYNKGICEGEVKALNELKN